MARPTGAPVAVTPPSGSARLATATQGRIHAVPIAALAQLVEQLSCNSDAVVVVTGRKAKRGKALGSPARRLRGKPDTV